MVRPTSPTCRCFAERFRTLVVDQPGYGESDKPPVQGNYFAFAADALAALLDEVRLARVHLVGNSLGGGTQSGSRSTTPNAPDAWCSWDPAACP